MICTLYEWCSCVNTRNRFLRGLALTITLPNDAKEPKMIDVSVLGARNTHAMFTQYQQPVKPQSHKSATVRKPIKRFDGQVPFERSRYHLQRIFGTSCPNFSRRAMSRERISRSCKTIRGEKNLINERLFSC